MRRRRSTGTCVVALLVLGSAMPLVSQAHSEGVEAADPNTPPAVLGFNGAAGRYVALDGARRSWRSLATDSQSGMSGHPMPAGVAGHAQMHAGHDAPAQHAPATHQQ